MSSPSSANHSVNIATKFYPCSDGEDRYWRGFITATCEPTSKCSDPSHEAFITKALKLSGERSQTGLDLQLAIESAKALQDFFNRLSHEHSVSWQAAEKGFTHTCPCDISLDQNTEPIDVTGFLKAEAAQPKPAEDSAECSDFSGLSNPFR